MMEPGTHEAPSPPEDGPIPWGCWAIFVTCAAMFAWETAAGGSQKIDVLMRFGANIGSYTLQGEWWRLWGSTFLHIGLLHLAVNMYSLRVVGPTLEEALGTPAFLAVYAVAGLTGSLASAWFHQQSPVISAGASGALFGLFGAVAWLVYARRNRIAPEDRARVIRSMLAPIVINLVIGAGAGFDNAAHMGGLVGGTLVAMLLIAPAVHPLLGNELVSTILLTIGAMPFANEAWVAYRAWKMYSFMQ